MGNGEEYIWKPPDDDDFIIQHKQIGPLGESIQPSAAGVSLCKCAQCSGRRQRLMLITTQTTSRSPQTKHIF